MVCIADNFGVYRRCDQTLKNNIQPVNPTNMPLKFTTYVLMLAMFWGHLTSLAQKKTAGEIAAMISTFRQDIRGPYKDIRWFCKDGTINPPKEPCAEPGGNQRARYKDAVVDLARTNHVFLGQILATTPNSDFWDVQHHHSRLKQYILEKYLQAIDQGWVLEKAQYYRGAFQSEDEAAWGTAFLLWLLENDEILKSDFFFIKQITKHIPHGEETRRSVNIRTLSKNISDSLPDFQDLRIKIHGQPEASDINAVQKFYQSQQSKLKPLQAEQLRKLVSELELTFQPVNWNRIKEMVGKIPKNVAVYSTLNDFVREIPDHPADQNLTAKTAEKLASIRQELLRPNSPEVRLRLLDLSNALEEIFFIESTKWHPETARDLVEKICYTGTAAMGSGYLEIWEWDRVGGQFAHATGEEIPLEQLEELMNIANATVQWGSGMVNAVYKDVVSLFLEFEPLAAGFIDDQIRASVLLPLGNAVGTLSDFVSQKADLSNQVLDLPNQNRIRGLNPGIAKGRLEVIGGEIPEEMDPAKIYAFQYAPSDLKPVAGILTVSEGNMVSHVQLLARNLGIPNAVISPEHLEELKRFQGKEIFYAASREGRVIMKPAEKMTQVEQQLFAKKQRSEEKIEVPTERIELNRQSILNMREIDASASGRICGPKAANLAQLKAIFPEHVVEGIVLPFGIFRSHLDQTMPGTDISYWQFLNQSFRASENLRKDGKEKEATEYILGQLKQLREALQQIVLSDTFLRDLENQFEKAFGKPLGEVPVFLRSDTNMEDLKDFTGAGLNLTIFNVVKKEDILQGIRSVWASPYTERSFSWRQRYLLNPENVFPSILIIPSVDVDYSGVMITKGVNNGDPQAITVAFSRGAGGAVDGQVAESYLLHPNGKNELLATAREIKYRTLPATGGTREQAAYFDQPILNENNLDQLRALTVRIRAKMPAFLGLPPDAPLDVELGFKDNKIWLFQIRPFVENKNALTYDYLENLTSRQRETRMINMQSPVN